MVNPEKTEKQSQNKENMESAQAKGKTKKPTTPAHVAGGSVTAVTNLESRASQKLSQKGPATPTPPSVSSFNSEALAILREINTNQTRTNDKVESLAQRVDELYSFGDENYEEYDCTYDFDNEECSISDAQVLSDSSASNKRPVDEEEPSIFSSYAKKFKKTEKVDDEINQDLADLVNNAFREGMSDDKYNDLIKNIDRPVNCEALKETRVNSGVWSVLKHATQTEDSKLRGIQIAIVKATSNFVKILDKGAKSFQDDWVEKSMDIIGILGQANKWVNTRRKDLHKKDMDPRLHYLCSSSVQFTDQLYGDSIVKDIKDAQEINKISKQVSTRGRGYRGRGRFRGRFRGNNYPRRRSSYTSTGSYSTYNTQKSTSYGPKNDQKEHKK